MNGRQNQYNVGLDKNAANYVPLTPVSFLARSATVYPNHTSVVYEVRRFTWGETYRRCRRFASYLSSKGISVGDTVAAMLPNVPAMYELHFAVPMAGAVLNALNIRLDAPSIAFQLDHGGAKIILVDPEFSTVIDEALKLMSGSKPFVIDVDDATYAGGQRIGEIEYEAALALGNPSFAPRYPDDEWNAIALSYTSGTTGNPKGVVTHHRDAYLNAVSNILATGLVQRPAQSSLKKQGIGTTESTMNGNTDVELSAEFLANDPIYLWTLIAGAAPPVAVLQGAESIGIKLTHVYGLTEVYGPASVCAERPGWDALSPEARAQKKRRQGVPYPLEEAVTVLDPETMREVPRDGETIGEVMFRGNIVMKGYLKNEKATNEAKVGVSPCHPGLVSHRRPRRARRAGQYHHQGPFQGHHHLRRREHLLRRGRGHPVQAPGRAVRGGGRKARPEMGRGALRVPGTEGRREDHRSRDHRLLQKPHVWLQDAKGHRVRTRSEDVNGKNPEISAAQPGGIRQGDLGRGVAEPVNSERSESKHLGVCSAMTFLRRYRGSKL
jgi:fatty-acyl-CoA synthase